MVREYVYSVPAYAGAVFLCKKSPEVLLLQDSYATGPQSFANYISIVSYVRILSSILLMENLLFKFFIWLF